MKKIYLSLLTALFAILGTTSVWADSEEFTGKTLSVGSIATTLETGKWYFLFNPYSTSYTMEGSGNTLTVTTTNPTGLDAADNLGYLVQLEDAGTAGKYYLKSGLGNYYRNVTPTKNNGTEATTRSTSIYTIEALGTAGHWTLRSNNYYYLQNNNGALIGANSKGSAGGDRDWVFHEVNLQSVDDLTGHAYVKYVLDKGGLVRVTNRRASSSNLTDDNNQAMGAPANESSLQQVWILEKNNSGFTLRNGSSGRYLSSDDNFRSPNSTVKTMYIQYSPNNSGESSYVNISEKADFSGNTCLNLNNDGTTLFKWKCEGDQGSDWTITPVTNFTLQQVQAGLLEQSEFKTPEAGKCYRIQNMAYTTYLNEDFSNNTVNCEALNADKLSQYWMVVEAASNRVLLQNMCTERYITRQGGTLSSQYRTQVNKPTAGFTPTRTADATNLLFYIVDNGSVGLHCDSGSKVVGWHTADIDASTWGFEEVELTEDFIEGGRNSLNIYANLKQNMNKYKVALANLFQDNACTILKDEIQALSDEELAANADFQTLNEDIQKVILKVKNNTWQTYTGSNGYSRDFEKFFRVRDDYQVYSHYQKMSYNEYCGMSNAFGKLSGPTGITGKAGDIIYIFVDKEPSADCTLQVEIVADSETPGDHQTGTTTDLHAGLNAVVLSTQSTVYIFYQLNNPEKFLADYPDMKIHIEGGNLQGYWDATRGMTNADWTLLREKLLDKGNIVNLKSKRLVFAMRNDLVQAAEPNNIEGVLRVWNALLQNEEDIMGFKETLEGRFNNIWNCFSVNHGYMYATTYGTYYENSTIQSVMNYHTLTETGGGALWGPAHEMGHNHQACINGVGSTETSNNLFSNINVFLHGVSTSRGDAAETCFTDFANNIPWVGRGTWAQARFYYQLWLYYHAAGHNPDFYPRLFTLLRRSPINKGAWDNTLKADSDGDGKIDIVGGHKSYGKDDFLHIAKKMCEAAGEDLSEFFEAYGMFIPTEDYFVGDYSNYWVTTTQADIDEAKAYMHRYPKAGNIIFIEDRIKPSASIYGGVLEGKPASDTRVPISSEDCNQIGTHGDVGQYTDYVDAYTTDGYFYTTTYSQGVTTYKVEGTGAVGFKIYDSEGKLAYLSNKKNITLPSNVASRIGKDFTIVACEGNGYDVLVPYGPALYRGAMTAYYEGDATPHTLYYYGTGTAGVSKMNPLPANSIAYVKAGQTAKKLPTADLLQNTNVVNADGNCQNLVIDGDKPFYIPTAFTAAKASFTKSGTGYQALELPFAVSEGFEGTIEDDRLNKDAETIPAGKPVVVNGAASFSLENIAIAEGTYAEAENGYVLNEDASAVLAQTGISPFTFVFDGEIMLETAINELLSSPAADRQEVYDLSGRRITRVTRPGIYVVNGRKVMVKE